MIEKHRLISDDPMTEQFLIAKYNMAVEYEHLGNLEMAYQVNEAVKKFMYDNRIYGHHLQKKLNLMHAELRKKVMRSKERRKVSLP